MQTLEEVRRKLRTHLGAEEVPKLVNTRVFLRTGVNLTQPAPHQNADAALVTKVVTALREFGYPIT